MSGAKKISVRGRTAATVLAVAAISLTVATFSIAGGAGAATDTQVSVSYAAAQSQGDGCASGADAMSLTKQTTEDSYSFVVTIPTDLCSSVPAKALAYAMPDNRMWPWPQRLAAQEAVTFSDAGVYTITFAKGCDPVQFDLVTGAAPEVIDPFGDHHGPLVFPHTDEYNVSGSAYQYFPPVDRCVDPTSSTSTPDSSTSSTTEVPVTVEPATTIPTDGPSDTDPASVSGQPAATVGGVQATQSPASLTVAG